MPDLHPPPPRPETTHPLLWTAGLLAIIALLAWWFSTWMEAGRREGRRHGPIPLPQASSGEPDHLALIARRDGTVIDQGAVLFSRNCAACHGPRGDGNPNHLNPPPRNLRQDAWKNPLGGGPYGLYSVLTKGYGATMPGFPALSPEQRYALVHFLRETMVKGDNQAHWVENDAEAVLRQIPPPGADDPIPAPMDEAAATAAGPPPDTILPTTRVHALMAGTAAAAEAELAGLRRWLGRAQTPTPPLLAPLLAHLAELADTAPGLALALQRAVHDDHREAFARLLTRNDGSGVLRPAFSLASSAHLTALYAHLRHLETSP